MTYQTPDFRVKCQSKGDDEQNIDNNEFQESGENIFKHHDVDPNGWELLEVQCQVDPTEEKGCRSNRPLPCLYNKHKMSKIKRKFDFQKVQSGVRSTMCAASLEGCPLMWKMPLHLRINKQVAQMAMMLI